MRHTRTLKKLPSLAACLLAMPIACIAFHFPAGNGTVITIRPSTATESPSKTNTIPFQESFESYINTAPLLGTNGWYDGDVNDFSLVTVSALPNSVVEFPIATNHTRYACIDTEGDYLINVITGTQQHVWVDMLTTLEPNEVRPYTNGISQQLTLYVNTQSVLCAFARPPNTNNAIFVESSCQIDTGAFYRLSIHLAYLPQPTGGCVAVYLNDAAVNWPGGETLPGVPAAAGQGPWLRCVPGVTNCFPGLAFSGTFRLDDLVVSDHHVLPGNTFNAGISGAGTIRWPSDFGRRYQVDTCTNLLAHSWQSLGGFIIGNGMTNLFSDADGLPARFYRIRELDP